MKLHITGILFFILLAGVSFSSASAQEKIQVVTRTVSKSFIIAHKGGLNIKAEKATIVVKRSKDQNLNIKLLLISKNPSQKIAVEDLKYCDYKIENRSEDVFVSNFFDFKNNYKEISSNLSARYEVELPEHVNLIISNIYGELHLAGLSNNINVKTSFGQIYLQTISGSLNINSSFTDIIGERINGPCVIKTENGEVKLSQINAIGNINSHFGNIHLSQIHSSLIVHADMSQVNLAISNLDHYSLKFLAQKDKIYVPDELKKNLSSSHGNSTLNFVKGKIVLNVTTNFSSIHLK